MNRASDNVTIQGISPETLAKSFGTPLYVYDAEKIRSQIRRLRNASPSLQIKYAAKALTNVSILRLMKQEGIGVDVVSIEEARIALLAGFTPGDIMFTPNCVSFQEIEEGVSLGLNLNIDNLPMLEKFGKKYGSNYPCCLRLNPHIMAGGNLKISTGHKHSKFGISIQQIDEIRSLMKMYGLQIHGLHIHTGSEIFDLEVFRQMANILFDLAREFATVRFVDFGGGIKVGYKPGEPVTDVEALGALLEDGIRRFAKETGRQLGLMMEPGKFLVAESGFLIVRTNVVKKTPEVTFVGVDSGLNQLIRPMMYDAYHHILNASNPTGPEAVYNVVGNICETDTLAHNRTLPEVREGDLLVITNAGAYGYSMASNYNSRPRPAEVLIDAGQPRLIRRRDTLAQLLEGQTEINQ